MHTPKPFGSVFETTTAQIPDEIRKKIKNGWMAALLTAAITLAVVGFSMVSGSAVMGLDAWALLDVVLVVALAFGIYKKSRIASSVMFVYFLASKLISLEENGTRGIVMAVFFLVFFFQAARACFQYHAWLKENAAPAPASF